MQRHPARLALLLAVTACSTATPGNGAGESAAVSASAASRPGRLVRPESLPPVEPSMQVVVPVVPMPATAATADQETIARLEREARAIATATGCTTARQCRTAPVGVRACGGPRAFIVYCPASTDTAALARKLRELERVEHAYNEKSGMMSTCEMRLAPATALVGGRCTAAPAAGVGDVRVP